MTKLPNEKPLNISFVAELPLGDDVGVGVDVGELLGSSVPSPTRAESSGNDTKSPVTEEALAQALLASLVPETKLTTAHWKIQIGQKTISSKERGQLASKWDEECTNLEQKTILSLACSANYTLLSDPLLGNCDGGLTELA